VGEGRAPEAPRIVCLTRDALLSPFQCLVGPAAPDSWFGRFTTKTAAMTPAQRAAALEEDTEAEEQHASTQAEGQSLQRESDAWQHFVAFVTRGGRLWELDGRKSQPIDHGASASETLLVDAARVVKETYMARDPEELRFTMVALCRAPPQEE
jgi:ubiquitin carboxyl-terminal hydrolase L3